MNMKTKLFDFLNEGTANPSDVAFVGKFESALMSQFKNVSYSQIPYGKDNKTYDYRNGYIEIQNSYSIDDWSWANKGIVKILQDCNFSSLNIRASYSYYEVISKAEPKAPIATIGVSGDKYINRYTRLDINNNIAKQLKDWIKMSQTEGINEDMIKRLLWLWKSTDTKYTDLGSRDQGYGSGASVHITKGYDSIYKIKNLDKAFGITTTELEKLISERFRKDKLDFNWKKGVMLVNGKYTEVWD